MRTGMQWLAVALLASHLSQAVAQRVDARHPARSQDEIMIAEARQNPSDLHAVTAAGEYLLHQERWQQSIEWLSRAYALSNHDEKIGYDLATARIQAGELDTAESELSDMSRNNDTARIHSLLGDVQERRGNADASAREYYRAAQLAPSKSVIFQLADSLLQHKQYVGYLAESVKYFRYGVSKYPKYSKLMIGLGVSLYAAQEYDEAIRTPCAAVDLDPRDDCPVTFLGTARRVSPQLAAEVDERLRAFVARYPENAAANYEYAISLWERGGGQQGTNLPQVEELLVQATHRAPRWYEPHDQLGIFYESEKRYQDAIREVRRAAQLQPDFKPAHFHLASLYKHVGDTTRGAQESDLARKLDNARSEKRCCRVRRIEQYDSVQNSAPLRLAGEHQGERSACKPTPCRINSLFDHLQSRSTSSSLHRDCLRDSQPHWPAGTSASRPQCGRQNL